MARADYMILKVEKDRLFFFDLNKGNISVTNDAEEVVEELHKTYRGIRFIYRDSTGRWDELIHENGIFVGFGAYNEAVPA